MSRSGWFCVSLVALVGCSSTAEKPIIIVDSGVTEDTGGKTSGDTGSDTAAETGCTATPPPSGYAVIDHSRVVGSSDRGNNVAMTVDENGSPMMAYDADGGAGKQIWYSRWERNCHGWTVPVLVDEADFTTDTPRGISIAYDKSTHTTGIAYIVRNAPLTAHRAYEVRYATAVPKATRPTMKSAPWDTITKDPAPLRQAWTDTDPASPETIVIAVQGGSTWLAWEEPFMFGNGSRDAGIKWVRRDGTGPWGSLTKIPTPGVSAMQLGLVVDLGKNPTLSYVVTDEMETASTVMFHPLTGSAAPTTIMSGVPTSYTNAVLAIAGEKYVAAIYLHPVGWATGKTSLTYAHLDGSTWNTVPLEPEKGEDWDPMISIAATADQVGIAAPIAGSGGSMPTGSMFGVPKYVLVSVKSSTPALHGPGPDYFNGYIRWPAIGFDGTKVQIGFGQPTDFGAMTQAPGVGYWHQ